MTGWEIVGLVVLLAVLALIVAFFVKKRLVIKQFYGEVAVEMEKTTWPTRDDVINGTGLVLVAIVLCTAAVWVVDLVIGGMVGWMFKG